MHRSHYLVIGAVLVASFCVAEAQAEYNFNLIASTNTVVLRNPNKTLTSFGVPAINDGMVTFMGTAKLNGSDFIGIYAKNANRGSLRRFANALGIVPPSGGSLFDRLGGASISNGTTAFRGRYNGLRNNGVFIGSGGPLTTIAKDGDPAPIGTFDRPIYTFSDPVISNGTVAFFGFYNSGGIINNAQEGIFTGSGGPLTTIVKTGDSAPIGTFQTFKFFGSPAISGDTVTFGAFYSDGSIQGSGVFTHSGGPLTTIVKTGGPAPIGTFNGFGSPAVSGDTVAFSASYRESFVNGGSGIFTGNGGPLTTIIATGDPAPIGTFRGLFIPAISGDLVTFLATYNKIDGSLPRGGRGIFVSKKDQLKTIIKTGDTLFGDTVIDLKFSKLGVDSNGDIAFSYSLSNGSSGIAVANLVPEPSTLGLLVIGAVGLLLDRHCRSPKN